MEVILKQDVEHLGFANDLVKVKDGYARNFLLPRKLAVAATPSERKQLAETLKQRAHKEAQLRQVAEKNAAKLVDQVVKIGAKVGEKGRIFGSVNTIMLSDAFKGLGVEVDRKHIKIKGEAIKTIGTYQADVTFHREVVKTISFEVIEE
ncbi:MAG: 50S ribosomal protein L9 [Flavobacteriales bacterium]|nr:50S ribosomal protein L9 [Flavobacteriales bacterium]MBP9080364.1 50S ribosomal protein L9 [Flavobacteriales bacterium]